MSGFLIKKNFLQLIVKKNSLHKDGHTYKPAVGRNIAFGEMIVSEFGSGAVLSYYSSPMYNLKQNGVPLEKFL